MCVWLQDPADSTVMVGKVQLGVESATLANLEQQFWGRVLSIADLDGDGQLSCDEFSMLMQVWAYISRILGLGIPFQLCFHSI